MKLLDTPLTDCEKDDILKILDGNICRICISDDPEEIVCMLGFAVDRLSMLAYSRIKQLKNKSEKGDC